MKYLGVTLNQNNSIEEEIENRIALGNKAYFANKTIFSSKLISKYANLKLYRTTIRPVVTYACETWTLKEADIRKLFCFERKILRKIFGPNKNADGTWSIKTNNELEKIIKNRNIINHIKAQRLSWFGLFQRMQEDRITKRMYKWKPIASITSGRPKNRWEDGIMNDIKKLKINNWISEVQNRKKMEELC
ncbi:hypothetical protein C0J52_13487 [Blattella germanica]|nr:hypothetical protein C0J52_13487 [Blattella germanica]PSN53991.1 hypothetical protein C0J52_13487 [Blattella germanica]PSN53993.1 hypothetical protein C0J52_13487 [Blattella germanica]